MKLITCLIVFCLILIVLSSGLIVTPVSQLPKCPLVLEQFQNSIAPMPSRGRWVAWAEWLCPPPRRRSRWDRLTRWLHRLQRWWRRYTQRLRRWSQIRRERQACTDGAPPPEPLAEDQPLSTSSQTESAPQACLPSHGQAESISGAEAEATPTVPPETSAAQTTPRGPGRPREIPTDHMCCPYEDCSSGGVFGPHPKHDIVGNGTYTTVHGEKRQLYLCQICERSFSETAGTPFFGLKTPMRTVCIALNELAEGLGIRAVARIHGVEPDTVLDWLCKAGQHCEAVSAYMLEELDLSQVQLDELWTFVRKKEKTLSEWEKLHTQYGNTWIWVAFDPIHKLVVATVVGERTEEEALGLLTRLRARLIEACLPLFTSDALSHYAGAILQVFGKWIQPERRGDRGRFPKPRPVAQEGLHYATVQKAREKGRVVEITTQAVYGQMDEIVDRLKSLGQTVNTSYVERMNLSLRHLVSRLHRKTLCFSKKREYLVYHLHLALAYYHFTLEHASLRERLPEPLPTRGSGSPKIWRQRTPAMAAGLTDHVWTMEELLRCHVPP